MSRRPENAGDSNDYLIKGPLSFFEGQACIYYVYMRVYISLDDVL